jgi:hypothetical protein
MDVSSRGTSAQHGSVPRAILALTARTSAAIVAAALLAAPGSGYAQAASQEEVVRPIVALGLALSDSGYGFAGHFGLGVVPLMLRASLDVGGGNAREYVLAGVHGDWSFAPANELALFVGGGIGWLTYGHPFGVEGPSNTAGGTILLPEVGILLGPRRSIGRIFFTLTGVVPTFRAPGQQDPANPISPPHVMGTLLFSL